MSNLNVPLTIRSRELPRVTKAKGKTRMPETSQYTIGCQDKRVARVEKESAIVNSKIIKSIAKRMKGKGLSDIWNDLDQKNHKIAMECLSSLFC